MKKRKNSPITAGWILKQTRDQIWAAVKEAWVCRWAVMWAPEWD